MADTAQSVPPTEPASQESQAGLDEDRTPTLRRVATADQPRVCWICYADSNEDDETTSTTWRTPCPCALTAHEGCLLDWVADLENPKNRKGTRPDKILCPQCKSEIRIARPRSLVIDGMKGIDQLVSKLTFPGVIFTFAGTLWAGAFYHGLQSLYLVFGEEDADRILHHAARHSGVKQVGLPLIPISLIMARTRYRDFILPATTFFIEATQMYDGLSLDFTIWPPAASTVFACLPLVQNVYSLVWRRTFGELEKKWLAEVQPRAGQAEDNEQGAQQVGNMAEDNQNDDVVFEMEVNFAIGGGDDEVVIPPQDAAAPPPPPPPVANLNANRDHAANDEARPQGNANAAEAQPQPAQAQAQQGPLVHQANAFIGETTSTATSILGALLFPAISSGMGVLLEHVLPVTWTTPPVSPPNPILPFDSEFLSNIWSMFAGKVGERTASGIKRLPLLQTRWGRSVIGGCLFVVVKDFAMLYWRYRSAKNHRSRRVMDWDKRSGTWRFPSN